MDREGFFKLLQGLSATELKEVQTAYWLAKDAHREQERDGGTRYFEHPRAVAIMLIERGLGTKTAIIKALLHDILEDTFVPPSVIIDLFGSEIWESLKLLSKKIPVFDPLNGKLIGRTAKTTPEYFSGLVLRGGKEDRIVKCVDRLHNLLSMGPWDQARKAKYAEETRQYIIPMSSLMWPNGLDNELRTIVEEIPAM